MSNKQEPLVSILMGAYNRADFIGYAIESIIKSTYTNWELIIVDDRSTDDTYAIARSYAEKDDRIKVFLNESNLGDYPNRNKTASYATGKYLKYIDHDDAVYPWGVKAEVEMMESFPDAGYGLDSLAQNDERMYPYLITPEEAYSLYYSGKLGLFDKSPTSSIIKREIFVGEGGFKKVRMVGDVEMWHRLSMRHSVLAMPHGIIWSRGHAGSESSVAKGDSFVTYHYFLIKRKFLEDPQCPLPENEKEKYIARIVRGQARVIVKAMLNLDFNLYKRIREIDDIGLVKLFLNLF